MVERLLANSIDSEYVMPTSETPQQKTGLFVGDKIDFNSLSFGLDYTGEYIGYVVGYNGNSVTIDPRVLNSGDYYIIPNDAKDKNITLYLVKALPKVKLTLNVNGGVFRNPLTPKYEYVEYNSKVNIYVTQGQFAKAGVTESDLTFIMADAYRDGYTLECWTKNGTPITVQEILYMNVISPIEIIANWTANEYTLTLDANGGTFENLYVGGDGAGITRGLAQAGASGVWVARSIVNREKK